jgi:hypothetical protein
VCSHLASSLNVLKYSRFTQELKSTADCSRLFYRGPQHLRTLTSKRRRSSDTNRGLAGSNSVVAEPDIARTPEKDARTAFLNLELKFFTAQGVMDIRKSVIYNEVGVKWAVKVSGIDLRRTNGPHIKIIRSFSGRIDMTRLVSRVC